MSNSVINRRHFLRRCGAVIAVSGLPAATVFAEAEKVSEQDPTAVALGYQHDASEVDIVKFPKRADEAGKQQLCRNCSLFLNQSNPDAQWAPCSIFQNRAVAAEGWCNAWVPKPAG